MNKCLNKKYVRLKLYIFFTLRRFFLYCDNLYSVVGGRASITFEEMSSN